MYFPETTIKHNQFFIVTDKHRKLLVHSIAHNQTRIFKEVGNGYCLKMIARDDLLYMACGSNLDRKSGLYVYKLSLNDFNWADGYQVKDCLYTEEQE